MYLTIRTHDKKLLILKEISMEDMTAEERGSALNEVQILKVHIDLQNVDSKSLARYYIFIQ